MSHGVGVPGLDTLSPAARPQEIPTGRSPHNTAQSLPTPQPGQESSLLPGMPPYAPYPYAMPWPPPQFYPYAYPPPPGHAAPVPPPQWPSPVSMNSPFPPPPLAPYAPGYPPAGYPPHPGYPAPAPAHKKRDSSFLETLDQADIWSQSDSFHIPGLSITTAALLRPKAFEVNPLLAAPKDGSDDFPELEWNIAFPETRARKRSDESSRALSGGPRSQPATHPPTKQITIILRGVRWQIHVSNDNWVTVGDVLLAVSRGIHAQVKPAEWRDIESATNPQLHAYYKRVIVWANFNRSTDPRAPGGAMSGNMERLDCLCDMTAWAGLRFEPQQRAGRDRVARAGYCVFVLELEPNGILLELEV